LRSDF